MVTRPSTFGEGIERLKAAVGEGNLKGSVEVDQVYAHYQHENPEFEHPRGGKPYYLRDPLFAKADEYMEKLARRAITDTGSELKEAMAANMEDLSDQVAIQAPIEFGNLKESGHPKVESDGVTVYDRPPHSPRLSKEEIRALQRSGRQRP